MKSRASTVDLAQFQYYGGSQNFDTEELDAWRALGGVYLGKKFTGQFYNTGDLEDTTAGNSAQLLTGWIESSDGSVFNTPPYELPDGIPDYVNNFNIVGYAGANPYLFFKNRQFVGDGSGAIGPFTFDQAMRIFTVLKTFKVESSSYPVISATVGGASATTAGKIVETSALTVGSGTSFETEREGFDLFARQKRYFQAYAEDSAEDFSDPLLDEGYEKDVAVELFVNYEPTTGINIIVDVDNLGDYYVSGIGFLLSASANGFGLNYKYSTIEGEFGDEDVYAEKDKVQTVRYILSPVQKEFTVPTGSAPTSPSLKKLSAVGDSSTHAYDIDDSDEFVTSQYNYSATYTYVSFPVTLNLGFVSIQSKIYGLKIDETSEQTFADSGAPLPPTPSVSISLPNPALVIQATEYWPYKNAAGNPVYNETTGAVVNPPIP